MLYYCPTTLWVLRRKALLFEGKVSFLIRKQTYLVFHMVCMKQCTRLLTCTVQEAS